ncbi:hypothetical protein RchiOBHm_Chr7g0226451 [Rosa chinensis]|uniref:Uncharacterized protein n=1 Tax=Rosa chinensis TaxID=74649 RepID=A0A2P6PED9_ROSCH|nr:hypothetical protein RchiOBHm_Chr7g0226451 [Rosa chinensis]
MVMAAEKKVMGFNWLLVLTMVLIFVSPSFVPLVSARCGSTAPLNNGCPGSTCNILGSDDCCPGCHCIGPLVGICVDFGGCCENGLPNI